MTSRYVSFFDFHIDVSVGFKWQHHVFVVTSALARFLSYIILLFFNAVNSLLYIFRHIMPLSNTVWSIYLTNPDWLSRSTIKMQPGENDYLTPLCSIQLLSYESSSAARLCQVNIKWNRQKSPCSKSTKSSNNCVNRSCSYERHSDQGKYRTKNATTPPVAINSDHCAERSSSWNQFTLLLNIFCYWSHGNEIP